MKRFFFLLFLSGIIGTIYSQEHGQHCVFELDLWPQGMPNTNGKDHLPEDLNHGNYKPTIKVFLPDSSVSTGRVVVACPGGGYARLALEHEGSAWAPFFNERGIALVVVKYRMPNGNKNVPVSDVQQAIRLVRKNAEKWNVNPQYIGIMGASAGGHLASTVATHSPVDVRPNFQILFYPVISMKPGKTHRGSMVSFLGTDTPEQRQIDLYSNELQVRQGETPPAIILLTHDDQVVNASNGVDYYKALLENKIPAALYVYPQGGHGWGFLRSFPFHEEMKINLSAWLEQLKIQE